jgi:hypothetical protein
MLLYLIQQPGKRSPLSQTSRLRQSWSGHDSADRGWESEQLAQTRGTLFSGFALCCIHNLCPLWFDYNETYCFIVVLCGVAFRS